MVMCWEKDKRAPTRPSASKAVRECVRAGRVCVNRKRVREVPRSQFWSVQPLRRVSSPIACFPHFVRGTQRDLRSLADTRDGASRIQLKCDTQPNVSVVGARAYQSSR